MTIAEQIAVLTQPRWVKFMIAAGGIYGAYIKYGLVQEKLFVTDYSGDEDDKFTYSFAILLFQNLFSFILAASVNKYYYGITKSAMDFKTELTIAGSNFGTMICANTALSFVSYPVQALLKSSKIISILLVSLILGKAKKYTKAQYFSASVITMGIIVFNLFGGKDKKGKETSIFGLFLLLISLFCDGMIGTTQSEAKEKFNPSAFDQMESANKWCAFLTLVFALITFQMGSFLFFCISYPAVIADLVTIAALGTVGQVFIFYTIFNFTPLILSILTTTRKFFTVLASIVFYQHEVNNFQWMAIGLVFVGVFLELYEGSKKKAHEGKKSTTKLPVTTEDTVELNPILVPSVSRQDEDDKLK